MEDERAWFISQIRKVVDLARCHPVHLRSMEVRGEGSSTKMELDAPSKALDINMTLKKNIKKK